MERLGSEAKCSTKVRTGANRDDIDESERYDGPSSSSEKIKGPGGKRIKLPEDVDSKQESKATADDSNHKEAFSGSVSLRHFKRIPIFLVDYHNNVLEFIYRCFGSRYLPLVNNTLLHFDSHPDMVVPRDIPVSCYYDKYAMLKRLSIENWIMPLCYTGQFKRVVWVKNSWCTQIPVGKYNFKVGHKDDEVRVNCGLDYFISEGSYCDSSELQEARDIELVVVNADTEDVPNPKELLSGSDAINYILDIDLDFFSTDNPFLNVYENADCYSQLAEIFRYDRYPEESDESATNRRREQLDVLKAVFDHLEKNRNMEGVETWPKSVITREVFVKIDKLVECVQSSYLEKKIDWNLIYESGCTADTNGLPYHVSTATELNVYYTRFKEFLRNLPHPPITVTIALSASDAYCPPHQVLSVNEKVIEILVEVFGDKIHENPILYYMDEEWDMKNL